MTNFKKRYKPRGNSVTIVLDNNGPSFEHQVLPSTKDEIELHIAKTFCEGVGPFRHHISRYGEFTELESQPENSIDFRVSTKLGWKWLELAEFAPLIKFQGNYENASGIWGISKISSLVIALIIKKNVKKYGDNVILIIYQTDDSFFVPPPIIRNFPEKLAPLNLAFEAIYFVSPSGMVMEAWPGPPGEQGPRCESGTLQVGTFLKPNIT